MYKYKFLQNDLFREVDQIINNYSLFRKDRNYLSKCSKSVYNAVSNFGVPTFESGALKLLYKVFPEINGRVFKYSDLSPQEVKEMDKKELIVYARKKKFMVSDSESLDKVLSLIDKKIYNLQKTISISEVIETLPKGSSAGFPFYGKKSSLNNIRYVYECLNNVLKLTDVSEMHKYINNFPVTIFHRFTPKMKLNGKVYEPNFKIRQILGEPFFIVALEKLILFNFVESFKKSFSNYYTVGLTKSELSERIRTLRNEARNKGKLIICGDIHGCDKSISLMHSKIYFSLAQRFIPENMLNLYKAFIVYYLRTPMIYSDGLIYSHGSTVTGSWITSSFTTLSVIIPILYYYIKLYGRFPKPEEFQVQGDDFILIINKESDKYFFKSCLKEFNLRLRLDKSNVVNCFDDIEFLGYNWDQYNQPDQSNEWVISKILYPERYMQFDGPLRIIYRILSIIINLKRFRELYYKIYQIDNQLQNFVDNYVDFKFTLISESNQILNVKIPINEFLSKGWRIL